MTLLPLIIYHANCLDGFGAAYAAFVHFRTDTGYACEFHPASHGDAPPDCTGRDVYILDFSYKRDGLNLLCDQAHQVTLIDHHITAEREFTGLERDNFSVFYDVKKSGAVLAWEFFHQQAIPQLLLHIQDQDIWQFKLDNTRAVNAALRSSPMQFSLWDSYVQNDDALQRLIHEGEAVNRYREQLIEYYVKRAVEGEIAGFKIPMVNCPSAVVSDVLHVLCEDRPFAASYQDKGLKRGWSLRSADNGEDVSRVAERFGGGGHPHAAGFATQLPAEFLCINP